MGLVILITVGAILGWLASIVFRVEAVHDLILNVGTGIGGALISAVSIEAGPFPEGISATVLLIGIAGALVVLTLLNVIRQNALH